MPYKDREARLAAGRRYRERVAAKQGRTVSDKAGAPQRIKRCSACPEVGDPCRDCYNAHRRTYRVKAAGYIKKYESRTKRVYPKKNRPFKHKADVVVKPVDKFLSDELFCCPGCMRKMRGEWRYCNRCQEKNVAPIQ